MKWKHYFFGTILFFLLDALLFGADDLKVRVHPKMGMAPLRNVLVMVEIKEPEKFWCPSIEIEWALGNTSKWESDCSPEVEGEKVDDIFQSFRLGEKYAYMSSPEIFITIKQGKNEMRTSVTIIVAGGE